jgi:hypothetical protein
MIRARRRNVEVRETEAKHQKFDRGRARGRKRLLAISGSGKKFLEGQGYFLKENVFYQDNKSTIQFEKNGRKSCGPNSRHIDIRYFWIKDRLDIEDITVVYCPTEQMLADSFTKPLQGGLFRRLKAVVMGHENIDSPKEIPSTASQERVGESTELERIENEADGRRADVRRKSVAFLTPVVTPKRQSYSEIVKRRMGTTRRESKSGVKRRGRYSLLSL